MIIESYKEREEYIRQFIDVFTLCAINQDDFQDNLSDDVVLLTQTSARGLELQILSILDRYRTKYVEAILRTQDSIADFVDPEAREKILSERSLQYSKPGRVLARILANSDSKSIG
jgi:hypothetical protein